jgi:hypothetical protein
MQMDLTLAGLLGVHSDPLFVTRYFLKRKWKMKKIVATFKEFTLSVLVDLTLFEIVFSLCLKQIM